MSNLTDIALVILDAIARLTALAAWVFGIVLAKGFWSTFFAVIFPLWGYILIAMEFVK